MSPPHKIIIEHIGKGRYSVHHADETLIGATRQPEFDACRALLARGITGRLETWRHDVPYPCMRLDIEGGAKFTVEEREKYKPRFRRWTPHPAVAERDAVSCLRGQTSTAEMNLEASTPPPELGTLKIPTTRQSSRSLELEACST